MSTNPRLLGVVLCGGRSSRMGQDKALLLHQSGRTFLQHAVDRLATICGTVVASGKDGYDDAHSVTLIRDPIAYHGPVTGISASLKYATEHSMSACFITPVDLPNLTVSDLRKLMEQWIQEDELTLACTDRPQPLVGIYPIRLLQAIEKLAASPDRSLSRWLEFQTHHLVRLPSTACLNINTPEDLPDAL